MSGWESGGGYMPGARRDSGLAGLQPLTDGAVDPGMELLRPFMLLACVAFTVGFIGYWALVGVLAPPSTPQWALVPEPEAPAHALVPVEPALAVGKRI